MNPPVFLPRLALLVSLATMSAGHASPSAHFELEDLGPLPAGKRLADLHTGEPYTVRMIYFLPNDRPYRQDVVDSMKTTIRQLQALFSDQMEDHGYGARTFRYETDAEGAPVVHRLDGRHPDSHYLEGTFGDVMREVREMFSLDSRQVNFLVVDNSTDLIDRRANGVADSRGADKGDLLVTGGFRWTEAAHELGHALGLEHDFREGAYLMSYGDGVDRLSPCAAAFLAVHPYFTTDAEAEESPPPALSLTSNTEYPEGATSVPIQLQVSAPHGLHQVILFVRTQRPHPASGFLEVVSCRGFEGNSEAVVEFQYGGILPSNGNTDLSDPPVHPLVVRAVDMAGKTTNVEFALSAASIQRSVTILEGHGNSVHSVAFSPDGTLVSGAYDGTMRLWEVEGGTMTAMLTDPEVESVAFSPLGTILASGSQDGTVRLWDVEEGKETAELEGHTGGVQSVAFSPPGTVLASGAHDGSVKLWAVEKRAEITTLEGHVDGVEAVAISVQGVVAAGARDGRIKLWDVDRREHMTTLEGHESFVQSVAFSPDGSMLASGSLVDRRVRLWDVATGEQITSIAGAVRVGVTSVAFSPDGSTLALGSYTDGTVELWDLVTSHSLITLTGHTGTITSVAFHPDGLALASGASEDFSIRLWDLSEWMGPRPRTLAILSGNSQGEQAGTQLPDPLVVEVRDQNGNGLEGVIVTFAVRAGNAKLSSRYDVERVTTDADGRAQSTLTLGPDPGPGTVEAVVPMLEPAVFTFEGTGVAPPSTGVDHRTGYLPDGAIARLGRGSLGAMVFSPDDKYLAVAGSIGAWIYGLATNREVALFTGHKGLITAVAFSPDGSVLASGSADQTVKLWDFATGEETATLRGHPGQVTSVAFSPDGSVLASGSYRFISGEGVVYLWDADTGQDLFTLWELEGTITSVAFSPDGSILAASGDSRDPTIKLWDVETGTHISTIEAHSAVNSIAFAPDGRSIAAGLLDGRLRIWDPATGEDIGNYMHIDEYQGWSQSISWVAFAPDSETIAYSAVDGKIRLRDLSTGRVVAIHEHEEGPLAISSDGRILAVSGRSRVTLWDLATKSAAFLGGEYVGAARALAFSPDGMVLATGMSNGTWRLWDVATGDNTDILEAPPAWITTSIVSPDGTVRASWETGFQAVKEGYGIKLLDASSGEIRLTLEGHTAEVLSAAFSPDGSILASASDDGTVLLWDLRFLLPHPKTLTIVSGDEQEGPPSTALADSLVVEVRDQNGDLFEGARVTFAVTAGDGTLSTATATTDARGRASTTLALGEKLGAYTVEVAVEATVAEVDPVNFTATARATPDFNGDGLTDFADFFLFAEAFGGSDPRFDLDNSGSVDFADFFLFAESFGQPARAKLLALARERIGLPDGPQLQQNAPNPFNSGTVIPWFLLQDGPARLEVYALTGQRVAVLSQGPHKAGLYRFRWDGRDDQGRHLASGVYLYRLVTSQGVNTRKLTLLR